MREKLPYYMVYPMPLAYDDERIERRDYEYMKSLYPDVAKRILPYVEEECDRCDCPCSMMYDEYPDHLMVTQICRRISDRVQKESGLEPELLQMQESYRAHSTPIDDLVRILFCHEMFERRCRRRRARRYF